MSNTYKDFHNIDTEKYFKPYEMPYKIMMYGQASRMVRNPNYAVEEFDKNFDDVLLNLGIWYD